MCSALLLRPCPFNLSTASVMKSHKTALSGYYTCLSCDLLLMPSGADTHTHTPSFTDETISRNQARAGLQPTHTWFKSSEIFINKIIRKLLHIWYLLHPTCCFMIIYGYMWYTVMLLAYCVPVCIHGLWLVLCSYGN